FTPHSSILSFRRLLFLLRFFFFHCYGPPPDLHSFPTRRSSDLVGPTPAIRATRPLRADAVAHASGGDPDAQGRAPAVRRRRTLLDRKSTRLNSSHVAISYAVFCLKKKKKTKFI